MLQVAGVDLEHQGFGGRIEAWRHGDRGGVWLASPDVQCAFVKAKHDYIWRLCASAVSAFAHWLHTQGQPREAAEVIWRYLHKAPTPTPRPVAPSGVVQTLPGQLDLF